MTAFRFVPVLLVIASNLLAQTAVVDEAAFTLTRGGAPFGSESYKIVRRLGAEGVEYVAQSTRILDGSVIRTALTTDSAGSATSYSRSGTGATAGQLTARRTLNRLTVDEAGGRSSSKDYLFAPGTLILDDDLLYQLYFVTWQVEPRAVGFVAPGARTSGRGNLVELGREAVSIRGRSIPARHFAFGTGVTRRDIWVDFELRLLKVAIPGQQIEGTRDEPPR